MFILSIRGEHRAANLKPRKSMSELHCKILKQHPEILVVIRLVLVCSRHFSPQFSTVESLGPKSDDRQSLALYSYK